MRVMYRAFPLMLLLASAGLPTVDADCPRHSYHCAPIPNIGLIQANATVEVGGSSEGSYANVTTNNSAADQGNVTVNVTAPSNYTADTAEVSSEVSAQGLDWDGDNTASKTIAKGETAQFVFPFAITDMSADIPILVKVTTPEGFGTTTLTIHFIEEPADGLWDKIKTALRLPGPPPALVLVAVALLALALRRR